MRFLIPLTCSCCIATCAFAADTPVVEIRLGQDAPQHAQLKADFSYKEMQRAEWNVTAAEREMAEAERTFQQAQHQANDARQRLTEAKQKVEKSRTALQEARIKWDAASQTLQHEAKPAGNAKQ